MVGDQKRESWEFPGVQWLGLRLSLRHLSRPQRMPRIEKVATALKDPLSIILIHLIGGCGSCFGQMPKNCERHKLLSELSQTFKRINVTLHDTEKLSEAVALFQVQSNKILWIIK